eukprot:6420886-Prymnesium_polylepis.1
MVGEPGRGQMGAVCRTRVGRASRRGDAVVGIARSSGRGDASSPGAPAPTQANRQNCGEMAADHACVVQSRDQKNRRRQAARGSVPNDGWLWGGRRALLWGGGPGTRWCERVPVRGETVIGV